MDAIAVIGGGPAGSTVATLLAQRGFQVRLYEVAQFPRAHIGESLLPATMEALELTGAAKKVRAAGFTIKNGATMAWGEDRELWTWYFRETNVSQTFAYQVNRDEFDDILLKHAIDCGVEVHEETQVDRVVFEGNVATGIEIAENIQAAAFVVDGSGQQSLIANQLRQKTWDDDFRNLAVYQYFNGAAHLEGDAAGNILVESVPEGWLWKIPLKHGVSSVGVVADRTKALEAIRKTSVSQWFDGVVNSSLHTAELLAGAKPLGSCSATRDWSYQATSFAGPRHCLIGDAACFIDPLFSTGVHLAIFSAMIAAAYVTTVFRTPALAELAATAFERQYRQQYQHFRELAHLFYGSNQSIDSYFWQTRQITGEDHYTPRAAFVRAVSGQTSRGYERTTLSHGVLPTNFVAALKKLETNRSDREAVTRKLEDDLILTVADGVIVEDSALFTGEIFASGNVIRRPALDDISISPFVAEVIRLIEANTNRRSTIAVALLQLGWPTSAIDSALDPAMRLLFIEGIIEPISR